MEPRVAFADAAKRPAHGFLYKIAVVGGGAFDEGEALEEKFVRCGLVVQCNARQEGEGGALYEFGASIRPLRDCLPGVRRFVEQMKAKGVADAPTIEVAAPPVHLNRCNAAGLVDKSGEQAGLVNAGIPECEREIVIAPEAFGEQADTSDRNTEGVL